MVFKGATGNANNKQEFEMKPHIVYPMDGGTALITFEEEVGEFLRFAIYLRLLKGSRWLDLIFNRNIKKCA